MHIKQLFLQGLVIAMNRISTGSCRRAFVGILSVLPMLALSGAPLHAETKVQRVDPHATDAAIETVHGPHLAIYDPQGASNHRLLVFLVGSENAAESSLTINSAFTKWGYHAVALDYENNVSTPVCTHSADTACYDHYREAIITGAAVSDKVSVNRDNSILNRLEKLLAYLAKQDPDGGWGEFIANGQPAWSRIVVAGHSQGAGHAAYLGKMFAVDEVLIFSGPQDYFIDMDKPAPWLSRPSATPSSRYFAFLNTNDPSNVHHQIASCSALMSLSNPATPMVKPGAAITGNPQILVNDIVSEQAHYTPLFPELENVWHYFATAGDEKPKLTTAP